VNPARPPERQLALYEALIATQPELERKGATNPYTSVNGNMFTTLSPNGSLGIRLSQADREAFMKKYGTGLHEAHGTVMKEYVAVPDELFAKTGELAQHLAKSYEYAKTLKPKATARKARKGPG
jgi:TfoX/Sxy family transcriptional regulator of competence genes